MNILPTILLVLALVAFIIGTWSPWSSRWPRLNFIAMGLALWVLSILLGGLIVRAWVYVGVR